VNAAEPPAKDDADPPPSPPSPPDDSDCCRSSCDPCVFDLYDAAVERYEAELARWQKRRAAADAKMRPDRDAAS